MEFLCLVKSYISKAKTKASKRLKQKKKKEDLVKSEIPSPPSQRLFPLKAALKIAHWVLLKNAETDLILFQI